MTTTPAPRPSVSRGRLIAVTVAGLGLLWLVLGLLSFPGGEGWGFDYRAYVDAANRLAETGTLYLDSTIEAPYSPGPYGIYYYAPPLAIAVAPLAGVGVDEGIIAWWAIHVLALALACALMPVPNTTRLVAFGVAALSYAVTRDLVLGNVSVILLLLMSAAWRWLDRPLGSNAQARAMAIRPTLGVLLIWQSLRRQWRAVAWTLGAGVVIILSSLPFVGIDGYLDFVAVLRNLGGTSGVQFNHDLASTVLLLGASEEVATMALLLGFAAAIAAIAASLRREREVGFMVTTTATLLLSPILWDHYLAMLILPAAFLAARGRPGALALPLAGWLPALFEGLAVLDPIIVITAMLLPFLARAPRSADVSDVVAVRVATVAPLTSP